MSSSAPPAAKATAAMATSSDHAGEKMAEGTAPAKAKAPEVVAARQTYALHPLPKGCLQTPDSSWPAAAAAVARTVNIVAVAKAEPQVSPAKAAPIPAVAPAP